MIFTEKVDILWHKDHIHKIIPNQEFELDDNVNAVARMTIICFVILSILELNKSVLILMLVFLVLLILMKYQRDLETNKYVIQEPIYIKEDTIEEDDLDKFFPRTLHPIKPMDPIFFRKLQDEKDSRRLDENKRNQMTQEEIRAYQEQFFSNI